MKWIICFLVILFANIAKGETETTALGTQTKEPRLIMKYEFPEPVVDVIFDEATMTIKEARALGIKGLEKRKVTEKTTIKYPKIIVTEKEVRFLGRDGKILTKIPLEEYEAYDKEGSWRVREEPYVSPDGEYILKYKYGYECVDSVDLYNKDGTFVKRVEDAQFLAGFSPNGDIFVTSIYGGGVIHFYDRGGNLLKKCDLYSSEDIEFSSNNKYVVVEGSKEIYLFDINGNELWSKKRSDWDGSIDTTISSDGNLIGAIIFEEAYRDVVYIFDKKGEEVFRYELPFKIGNNRISISPKGDCLIASQGRKVWFFDLITKALKWEKETEIDIPHREYHYLENPISFSTSSEYIIIKGSNALLVFDKDGKEIFKKELSTRPAHADIDASGNVFIKTKKGFYLYEK